MLLDMIDLGVIEAMCFRWCAGEMLFYCGQEQSNLPGGENSIALMIR